MRVGVGDDAAVIAPSPGHELVVSVDMLVAGRHFYADADPESVGHKALAVNLSDMAAMGARPRWALLAGALPDAREDWISAFARGFLTLAHAHEVDLVGGDTTRGPLNLCVTIMGEVPEGLGMLRSGACSGDDIYVSGELGDAALALAALEGRTRLDAAELARCRERLERPQPRVALGLALRDVAHAGLDVSDGLTGDLAHILERSGGGAVIDIAAIPRSAVLAQKLDSAERELALACVLSGGDDYELCFTAPVQRRGRIDAIAREQGCALTRIGRIIDARTITWRDEHGVSITPPRGFDHFADSP